MRQLPVIQMNFAVMTIYFYDLINFLNLDKLIAMVKSNIGAFIIAAGVNN